MDLDDFRRRAREGIGAAKPAHHLTLEMKYGVALMPSVRRSKVQSYWRHDALFGRGVSSSLFTRWEVEALLSIDFAHGHRLFAATFDDDPPSGVERLMKHRFWGSMCLVVAEFIGEELVNHWPDDPGRKLINPIRTADAPPFAMPSDRTAWYKEHGFNPYARP